MYKIRIVNLILLKIYISYFDLFFPLSKYKNLDNNPTWL